MDYVSFIETSTNIGTPLALAGLALAVFFFIGRKLLSLDIFSRLSGTATERVVSRLMGYFFAIAIVAMLLGVAARMSEVLLPLVFDVEADIELSYAERVHLLRSALAFEEILAEQTEEEQSLLGADNERFGFRLGGVPFSWPPEFGFSELENTDISGQPFIVATSFPGGHCEAGIFLALYISDFVSQFLYRPVSVYIASPENPDERLSERRIRREFFERWILNDHSQFNVLDEQRFRDLSSGLRIYYRYQGERYDWDHTTFIYLFDQDAQLQEFGRGSGEIPLNHRALRYQALVTLSLIARDNPNLVRRELLYPTSQQASLGVMTSSILDFSHIGLFGLGRLDYSAMRLNASGILSDLTDESLERYYETLRPEDEPEDTLSGCV